MPYSELISKSTYISPTEAPPVAKAGLPRKPAINRRTSRPPMFVDSAVGICRIAKSASVIMYTGLRPIEGSSCSGDKI